MPKITFDTNQALGMAGGIFALDRLMEMEMVQNLNLDPKMEALAKVFLGDWLPKQKFAKKAIKNASTRDGLGAAMEVIGIQEAMDEFGIGGISQRGMRLPEDAILAVAIEGTNDVDYMDEEDDDDETDISNDDDLDTVNEDVLGEDDDLDTVNEDVLGDDDDEDDLDDYM